MSSGISVEAPGFGPWSIKEGVVHVRPPAEVLDAMLTVRINLDPNDESNGPLLVAPGTHQSGIRSGPLDTSEFESSKIACITHAGGVVLMRPLLFHASRKSLRPHHRRVLHIEFAAQDLPHPLRWTAD